MGHAVDNPPSSLAAWKAAARRGEATPEGTLRKVYAADSIKAEGERTYAWTISTGSVDRDRDTIAADGWRVDNFLKAGGPVLWAHQSRDLPIGKAVWVKAQAGVLKARVEFAPADVYPFAETVRRLVDFGALKATSVGFLPDFEKAAWNEQRGGYDFKGQELLEFSIVPVPANPDALMDAKDAGIDLAPLKSWAEGVMDGMEPGLWLPKAAALRALDIIGAPKVAGFDPGPFLAEFQKRGRTLSAANEERIRGAADAATAIGAALDEVLAQVVAPEPDPEKAPEPFILVMPDPPVPTFLVNPKDVVAATKAAVSETVRAVVNTARGRLD